MLRKPLSEWHFRRSGPNEPFRRVSRFPTNVHLDLLHHGCIPDPFVGTYEASVQWVGEEDWIYATRFTVPKIHDDESAVLVFEGLDTFVTVSLDGQEILSLDNMFVPARVNVTPLVADSPRVEHQLEILFKNAYRLGKELQSRQPSHKWGCWNGDPSRLAVRKAQYHYSWDWGPTLLTCGPWRPISLEIYSARIGDLYFKSAIDDASLTHATVEAIAKVEGSIESVAFSICLVGAPGPFATTTVQPHDGFAIAVFVVPNPQLWYPRGYGAQSLYDINAESVQPNLRPGQKPDRLSKRLGLRCVRLVEDPLGEVAGGGKTFYFQVNNVPILCAGSNWIPADSFLPRLTPKQYRDWVALAANGNQNMLRVWGGGVYEDQAFYDACDEFGILVWQDFMFACGNYPADDSMLHSVKKEVYSNVSRLRHHPCIVVWAGNNEDYSYVEAAGLRYDRDEKDSKKWLNSDFPARYIYEELIPRIIADLEVDVPYRPGCPWGGKKTGDPTLGDIHQWNVWHGTQAPYQDFDKLSGRFISEFGMESMPALRTIEDDMIPLSRLGSGRDRQIDRHNDPDYYPGSPALDSHHKATGGTARLAGYLATNFYVPDGSLSTHIYLTQLLQAECVSTALRLWRRGWKMADQGGRTCAGALVWQLNDCWPAISWALVDYRQRPKLAYYALARELAPLTLGFKRSVRRVYANDRTAAHYDDILVLALWAVNMGRLPRTVRFELRAFDILTGNRFPVPNADDSNNLLQTAKTLAPNASTELGELTWRLPTTDWGYGSGVVFAMYLFDVEAIDVDTDGDDETDMDVHEEPANSEDTVSSASDSTPTSILTPDADTPSPATSPKPETPAMPAARAVGWPEPLKHIHAQLRLRKSTGHSPRLQGSLARDGAQLLLTVNIPIKGVFMWFGDDIKNYNHYVNPNLPASSPQDPKFEDNCLDLVPGEVLPVHLNDCRVGDLVNAVWMGSKPKEGFVIK